MSLRQQQKSAIRRATRAQLEKLDVEISRIDVQFPRPFWRLSKGRWLMGWRSDYDGRVMVKPGPSSITRKAEPYPEANVQTRRVLDRIRAVAVDGGEGEGLDSGGLG